jgi:hypothetical protein
MHGLFSISWLMVGNDKTGSPNVFFETKTFLVQIKQLSKLPPFLAGSGFLALFQNVVTGSGLTQLPIKRVSGVSNRG